MTKEADNLVIDPFAAAMEVSDVKGRSPWEDAWHRLLKNRAAVYSAFIMAAMFLMVVFGPMLISWEPDFTDWDSPHPHRAWPVVTGLVPMQWVGIFSCVR